MDVLRCSVDKRSGKNLNEGSPNEEESKKKTCFVIMPISDHPDYPTGHFAEVYEEIIKPVAQAAGYECQRADDTLASHMIHVEIVSQVVSADLCICDLSTRNPNVLFEYGIRQAYDKPTVLMKDDKTGRIFDVDVFRFCEYDHTLRVGVAKIAKQKLSSAIRDTISAQGKENQIFSLVSFLKIQKAVMASKDISPEDARLALIEKKIDDYRYSMERLINRIPPGIISSNIFHERNNGIYSVRGVDTKENSPLYSTLKLRVEKSHNNNFLDLSDDLNRPTFLATDILGEVMLYDESGSKIFENTNDYLKYCRSIGWPNALIRKTLAYLGE